MTTETFTTPGQATWTAPFTGTVKVELWGAGAGGGGNAVASDGAGGGSAGGYGRLDSYSVTQDTVYTLNVGTQGVGQTSLAGTGGGVTWWRSAATFQVPGGTAGKVVSGGAPGGVATAIPATDASFVGTFDVKTAGGDGGAGVNNNNGGGGGGGGSPGDTTAGGNGGTGGVGTGGTAGTAGTTNGGIGGVGGGGANPGIAPVSNNGGGGGGSGEGVVKGGDGTSGKLTLTYEIAGAGMPWIPQAVLGSNSMIGGGGFTS